MAPHPVKKRRMCQHRKRAVARTALTRDDQNPLPLPVKGSMPECIAWAGIAPVIPEVSVGKEWREIEKQRWVFPWCLAPYIPQPKSVPGASGVASD